jgi:hypothetical protein
MPSADDLFNQLVAANNRLEAIKGNLLDVEAATDAVKFAVNQVNSTLTTGFGQLVTQGDYTNKALSQNAKQNDTIICILEHISKNTCELLNQSVIQTGCRRRWTRARLRSRTCTRRSTPTPPWSANGCRR